MKKKDFLTFLYHTKIGRIFLKILTKRWISNLCGHFLNTKASTCLIPSFIKKNKINRNEYEEKKYQSFNDFFTRKIKPELRPIDQAKEHIIAPCDGNLLVYEIKEETVLPIKGSHYKIDALLKDKDLSKEYENGLCLVYRLGVDNYHRYCYIETGNKGKNIKIKGKLHTVRPIALEKIPVFIENSREYTKIKTNEFGPIIQMEVGALLVGKIKNYHEEKKVLRGEEKGMFLFGGSTIIILIQKEQVKIKKEILDNSKEGIETPVKMGERVGCKK